MTGSSARLSTDHNKHDDEASSTGLELDTSAYPTRVEQSAGSANASVRGDVENPRFSACYSRDNDPFQLSSRLKSLSDVNLIKAGTKTWRQARQRKGPALSDSQKKSKLREFYKEQNERIEHLLKPVDEHLRDAVDKKDETQLRQKIAVHGSFAANVILSGLQLYGAIASGSLSLFTTMADSVFDPMSNVTLILSNRAVNKVDPRRFPSGKARVETVGNILFSFLMCSVSFILIVMSIRDLAAGGGEGDTELHIPSIIAVCVAFATKLCLFLYCWALRNVYSQVRILWEDHRNDLFINGFGILTSVGGSKIAWWIDPMGAIILSCLIAGLWMHTAYGEFQLLIGVTADVSTLQLITYVSVTHSPLISQIDTVRAYHSGPRLVVEVDIVMDPNETLQVTHDVSDSLQTKLESLPNVERAYVHVDYESSHKPEHFVKKEL
ncbi:hypothetical protein V1517DRAFT_262004 [Lipomyces orientalis]|uniref:Uncharacterized protein n=1 Tax=Lipomyces orientalis TaxID=1233043 RepID=A0ACC3TK96_9ASCO